MVCFDTPTSRATSSTLRPASNCFSAPIICASMCLLFDIPSSPFHLGRPAGKEHSVAAPRSAATIHLQSLSRIRGSERCRTAVARSDVSLDRLGEDLGSWGSVAFAPALVRDRGAEPSREPGRSEPNQSRADFESRGHGFTPAGGAGYGQYGNPGLWRTGARGLQRAFRSEE